MLLSVVVRTTGFGIWLHRPSGRWEVAKMAHGKSAAPGRRSRPASRDSRQFIKANVATLAPLSVIRTEEPVTMRTGDWISLAGLAASVIGFSVVIKELIRIAHASETSQARHQVNPKEADPLSGGSSSFLNRRPLRPELAALLGVWPSSQLTRCAGGRAG